MPTGGWVRAVLTTGLVLALAATTGTAAAGWAQATASTTSADVIAAYRARIPALMAREHVPGLAVVVVDGDRVLWVRS